MSASLIVALVTALGAIIPTTMTAMNGMNRRTRKKLQSAARERDELAAYIYDSRMTRHMHNKAHHPDGEGAIEIKDLPKSLEEAEE